MFRPVALAALAVLLLAETPARSQSVVLQTKSPGRDDFGTAFCVDAVRGLFVTDYQLVVGETAVRLGNHTDTKEFVAADRGKSLVLLKTPLRPVSVMRLAGDLPALNSPIALLVAPTALRGTFLSVESGEDYLLGLTDRRLTLPGRDRDTGWLRTDFMYGLRQRGAPLITEKDEVIGVVVSSDAEDNEVTRAVHVNHVRALLKQADAPPKLLADLRKHTAAPVLEAIPDWTELNLVSSLAKRGRPTVERLQQCVDRQQAERDQVVAEQADFNKLGAEVGQLKAQKDKNEEAQGAVNRRITAIHKSRPLVAYREPNPKYKPGRGKDDDKSNPRFVYRNALAPLTAEQAAALAAEQQSLTQLQEEWRNLSAQEQFKQSLQHAKRDSMVLRKRREPLLPLQLLTLVENGPFETPAQQQAIADWFAGQLRGKPSNDIYLVGHALSLLALQQHESALQRLDTAQQKVDEVPRAAISAARARVLIQMGKTAEGKTELAAALKAGPNDPLVLHWAGLAACDAGHFAKGAEYLQSALDKGGDPAAIEIALALVFATAPVDEARSGEKAVQHAARACELTYWQDWRALLVFAAALAERQEFPGFPRAVQLAEQLLQLAPAENQQLCQQWREAFTAGKPIRGVWR